jgi:hypothetical protein
MRRTRTAHVHSSARARLDPRGMNHIEHAGLRTGLILGMALMFSVSFQI